ncbi:MAG: Uncharacterized DUF554 membrane protein, partial [uncultured Solirubrobacteraceae bacterium]
GRHRGAPRAGRRSAAGPCHPRARSARRVHRAGDVLHGEPAVLRRSADRWERAWRSPPAQRAAPL